MSAQDIIQRVAGEHGIRPQDIKGQDRRRSIAWPRQQVMFELSEYGLSLGTIGRLLGRRHHATVIHGKRAYLRRVGAE